MRKAIEALEALEDVVVVKSLVRQEK